MVSKIKNGKFNKPRKVKIEGNIYNVSDVQITNQGSYLYFKMRGRNLMILQEEMVIFGEVNELKVSGLLLNYSPNKSILL